MPAQFALGPRLLHGPGSLSALQEFAGERVLLVTDAGIESTPVFGEIRWQLAGSEVTVFDKVLPDPSTSMVATLLRVYLDFAPHAIVAVGGGSVIDTAKATHLIAQQQGQAAPWGLAVVPTTSGSGSEVTSVAVVTDEEHQVKIPLLDERLMPRLAILDPAAVVGCPRKVTADSGMDALTHAFEAYVATGNSDCSDAFAEKAVRLIREFLPVVVATPSDVLARERMHNAATLAAVAFQNAGLGIVHSLAHAIGGHFHVAHGRINSIVLPHVVAFNAGGLSVGAGGGVVSAVSERYTELARAVGLEPAGRGSGPKKLVAMIERLAAQLSMPRTLTEAGVARAEFEEKIDQMAEQALEDACTATNPVQPSVDDLRGLLRVVA